MNNIGIIILAAGRASRFGDVKQLLHYNGKTLIEHVIEEAIAAHLESIIVITGANAEAVTLTINHLPVQVLYNEKWQQGMASSIVAGVSSILSSPSKIEAIIIAVCDQPFVSSQLFLQIKGQNENGKPIVACAYADTIGTPVLFTRPYFDELLHLTGEEGAKKLIKQHKEKVTVIDFPQGNIDIDTHEDYKKLADKQRHVL